MRRPTVLHLAGSPTSESWADLSRLYAAGCIDALRHPDSRWSGHDHLVAWVTPDGSWRFPDDLTPGCLAAAEPVDLAMAVRVVQGSAPRFALPQMFCPTGMVEQRGLLDVLGIPYVGNRPAAMAVGADKAWSRAVVAAAGVAVPDAVLLGPDDDATRGGDLPPWPVVVKPATADNSDGVSLVGRPEDLAPAVERARRHGPRVLVERYVELGREVRCAVVELDGELVGLPLEEYAVDPVAKPVRGREDKLRGRGRDLGLVAKDLDHAWIVPTDDPATAAVHEVARRCFRALGCRDYGLFDLRLDPAGTPWFLEAGLYCSFSPTSVVVTMAAAAGIDLDDLLARLAPSG